MFKKILIANRGEIACRVMRTAKRMGIATVAVYSEADKDARHVHLADEAVCIGSAPSRESYLVISKILEAAKKTGAQAIHPGYGFLSENEEFAKQCEAEGIVFIGPKHHSIAAMGDKIASKKLANDARVNTIPGYNEPIRTSEDAVEIAQKIGYPVMIKASAGGGGKGLRVAFNDKECEEGFTSCKNEARNSFGDDRVFMEKFVEEPRHIEIQVLGDMHGNVVYLNERECSIQRRHQKVIEEAPSPFISEATRKAMGEQAVALAKAVQYQSAGTVEFVVGKDQDFYFLEMNTRLQVEHPVTECITGLDLVELMIRIAAGERLPLTQESVKRDGWAIECRINAEDPSRNFLPSTGRLVHFQHPDETMFQGDTQRRYGVRVDTGVVDGGEIPMYYDSMIAKLIVHGKDRNDAIIKMREALNGFVIRGISSNITFQSALLAHPDFVTGHFNTGFIAQHFAKGFKTEDMSHNDFEFLVALAAYVRRAGRERDAAISGQIRGHETHAHNEFMVVNTVTNVQIPVLIKNYDVQTGLALIHVNTSQGLKCYEIQSQWLMRQMRIEGVCNGWSFVAQIDRDIKNKPLVVRITHGGAQLDALVLVPHVAQLQKLMLRKPAPDMSKYILSPMPGLLADITVKVGQRVQAGERVAVIEAMKMENVLFASAEGVVAKVLACKGESLSVDQSIIEFE